MDPVLIALTLSTLLCSLVAGFVFAFAAVVTPGIKRLSDREFLKAFKAMDGVIQKNQPLFMLIWLGSILALATLTALSLWKLEGVDLLLVMIAAVLYFIGVQAPTAIVNIPLNNQLQERDIDAMTEPALREARNAFESRWTRWNSIRTVFAALTTTLLIVLAIRL